MKSSCIDCPNRHLGCQNVDKCERYKEYKTRCELINARRREENEKNAAYYGLKKNLAKKYAKTKKGAVKR
jgi:hypothetical protein